MSDDYTGLLLEDINHKFDILVEAIAGINQLVKRMPQMKEDIHTLKEDVSALRTTMVDQGKQLNLHYAILSNHDWRISTLEQNAA